MTDDFVEYYAGGGGPRRKMPSLTYSPEEKRYIREEEGYMPEEGYISADQLIQQANDYAEKRCKGLGVTQLRANRL